MRTSGIGISLFMMAIGAIMIWAITVDAEGIDLNVVGAILLIAGAVGFIATLAMTASPSKTIVERDREVVVDRETRD